MNTTIAARFRSRSALCVLALGMAALSPARPAAAQAPAAAPTLTPAQALERAKGLLAASQQREKALVDEVLALDKETDARIQELVDLLKGVKDSTASNTEVAQTKKQAVEALRRLVQVYAQERGKRVGQIQGPSSAAAREDLRKEVAALDREINQKVDQIVELAASMSTREETRRYDTYATDDGVVTRERDEYRAANRQASRADQVQGNVEAELEKAIANLEREIVLVPQRLPKDRQEAELARLNTLLKERKDDLRKLSGAGPSGGRAVGDREANQVDRELRYAQEDVRALWTQMQAKANQLSVERQRRRQLEARVSALERETAAVAP